MARKIHELWHPAEDPQDALFSCEECGDPLPHDHALCGSCEADLCPSCRQEVSGCQGFICRDCESFEEDEAVEEALEEAARQEEREKEDVFRLPLIALAHPGLPQGFVLS